MPADPPVSLTAVWDETRAYVTREAALLLPVALATVGVATLLLSLAVPAPDPAHAAEGSPAMLWVLPYGALVVYGALVLSALALTPGISVGEALRLGGRRMLAGLVAFLLTGAAALGLFVVGGVVIGLLGATLGLPLERAVQLGVVVTTPALIILSARLVLALPAVAAGANGLEAVKRSWRLTARIAAKLSLLVLAASIGSGMILLATQAAGGSAILLAARLAGAPAVGALLVNLLVAFVVSVLQIVATSYSARLYRRLAESMPAR